MKKINNKILRQLKHGFWLCFIPYRGNNFRPRFLENNFLIWCVVFLFIAKLLVAVVLYMPKTTFFSNLTAVVAKDSLIALTNNERKAAGIPSLKINTHRVSESWQSRAKQSAVPTSVPTLKYK